MKIRRTDSAGSVITIMLVIMLILGVTLASYSSLVGNQNLSIERSQRWNNAIAVAEAGIEEAMAHLNYNTSNRLRDGWAVAPDGTNVIKERFVGTSKFTVWLNKDVDPPAILAKGYVLLPRENRFIDPPRTVLVTTTNDALFAKGMVAKGQIDLAGNNIRSDSFDSSDPAHHDGTGRYSPANAKDNGDIATNSSIVDSLNVWNAEVYGKVSTGPGGTVKISNGSVGSKAWVDAGNKGIEPGHATDDMNVFFPDAKLPPLGGSIPGLPLGGSVGTNSYKHIFGNGSYILTSLKLSGSEQVLVEGHTTLVIKHELDLTGTSKIRIAPGATLNLFMQGPIASVGGNGVVNENATAGSFSYWGLPTNKEVKMQGNASFTGTIYAPQAQLILGGGGSTPYDFAGAAVAGNVKMNGHFKFHYDEALEGWGPRRGYTVVTWNEATSWNEM